VYRFGRRFLGRKGLEVVSRYHFDPERRAEGRDWPPEADTMIGLHRLGNLEHCVRDVIERGVPGDLIETGVWRGGTCIFMRAIRRRAAARSAGPAHELLEDRGGVGQQRDLVLERRGRGSVAGVVENPTAGVADRIG
jgi:Macrocin-O-methyltransferase (TylF)